MATEELAQTAEGQQTLYELQQHMSEAKNIFLEVKVAKNIMQVMDDMLEKVGSFKCFFMALFLLLSIVGAFLKNLLYAFALCNERPHEKT